MKHFKGIVKTSSGEREVKVRAHDQVSAERLMEREGKLLYRAKMIPG